jgi:hypothetical protein
MKQNIKTESVADFMARGGVINKVTTKVSTKKNARREFREAVDAADIDFSKLPMALRIKYGIR